MSLGVVRYCTPEGGSGFIANPALPWLSSFDITQESPVYDQPTAWLRDSQPGTFTYYPRFGPPYSTDGGVLPPYWNVEPQPEPTPGCSGLGAVDLVLMREDVVAPMPSITTVARTGCTNRVSPCPSGLVSFIDSNPLLALLLAFGLGAVLFGDKR